jgi:ATP-dependent helicase Lhr and Lhr-like helicase
LTPSKPLDVLVQHIVTVALSAQTTACNLLNEVRATYAYRDLTNQEWEWALGFAGHGGNSLAAYPEFHRVSVRDDQVLWVPDRAIARRHRMSVGTIVSDASVKVQYLNGSTIGTVEETFVSRLKKGDCFLFAGRLLELHRLHDMTAYVKRASGKRAAVPRWNGGKMPLSSELAQAFVKRIDSAASGQFEGPDMQLAKPLLQLQERWSNLPVSGVLLVEALESREGFHLFVYPFAGRHVHIGLSSLIAWRISQKQAATFSIAVNDYGFELLSATPLDWEVEIQAALQRQTRMRAPIHDQPNETQESLLDDVMASLNASELSQRRFREIARISGLITQGYPGAPRSNKQLQASSSLFYEVFKKYDSNNLLLQQAEREVLQQELELSRLQQCLEKIQTKQLVFKAIERPTPFAFPLMVERLREKLTTEKLSDRIARLVQELEKAATP